MRHDLLDMGAHASASSPPRVDVARAITASWVSYAIFAIAHWPADARDELALWLAASGVTSLNRIAPAVAATKRGLA